MEYATFKEKNFKPVNKAVALESEDPWFKSQLCCLTRYLTLFKLFNLSKF